MRKRLPLVIATGGIICMIVAAALVVTWVFGGEEREARIPLRSATEALPPTPSAPKQTAQRTDESSCLWYRGKIRWCLSGWDDPDDEWYISQYPEPEHRGRYYFQDHRDRVLGYLRPTSYGYRAMVSVCPKGPQPCGWARGGRTVRTGRRNEFYVYSRGNARGVQGCVFTRCDGLPRREVARGTHAIAIALYKFVLGDCQEAWTQKPCGT
jgi:hypothetical protein